MKLDLHMHSIYSDGDLSPEELVNAAISLDIGAISITDHDNVLAYEFAQAQADLRAKEAGKDIIAIIPGVEINTLWNNNEIHVLGYYMNVTTKSFQNLIAYQQHARIEQTIKIIENLNKKENIKIKFEDVDSLITKGGSIGRPHIAKAIANVGGSKSVIDSYVKYINNESQVYVPRKTVSPHEAVETIYEAGGIPVLAHPCDTEVIEELVKELINVGLRGLEVYHRKHSPAMVEYYSCMSETYGLIVTGGSDFHGQKNNKQLSLGKNFVPAWVLTELKKEKDRIEIASK